MYDESAYSNNNSRSVVNQCLGNVRSDFSSSFFFKCQ